MRDVATWGQAAFDSYLVRVFSQAINPLLCTQIVCLTKEPLERSEQFLLHATAP